MDATHYLRDGFSHSFFDENMSPDMHFSDSVTGMQLRNPWSSPIKHHPDLFPPLLFCMTLPESSFATWGRFFFPLALFPLALSPLASSNALSCFSMF